MHSANLHSAENFAFWTLCRTKQGPTVIYRILKKIDFYLTPTIIAVNKDAFLCKAYGLHQQILQMIETIFKTERLNFTAWHLPQFKPYLAEQIVVLKHCLETKSNRFFLRYIQT